MFDSEIVVAKCMREVKEWDLNVRSYTMSIEERKCLCSVKEILHVCRSFDGDERDLKLHDPQNVRARRGVKG